MQPLHLALVVLLPLATAAQSALTAAAEANQSSRALKIISEYSGNPASAPLKSLRVIYFTPSDREPVPQYQERLGAILQDLRTFYRSEMHRHGFGAKTFELEHDSAGKFTVHLVKGRKTTKAYAERWEQRRELIGGECEEALAPKRIWFSNETVAVVCNLANWNPETRNFTHPSPYSGNWSRTGGFCWLMDSPILNIGSLTLKEPVVQDPQFGNIPIGRRNSMFIGSIGHELSHAFGMPHSGERWDEKEQGRSLMGVGNLHYRVPGEGAFLTMASAMRLAARPLFNGSDKGFGQVPKLKECKLTLSTNVTRVDLIGRPAGYRLEGTVVGTPPVYGVIAYFDSRHDGGYRSPTATAVPDAEGKFAIEISDLEPCKDCQLFVSFCHANGTTTGRLQKFTIPGNSKQELPKMTERNPEEADASRNSGKD
jgi:hypothetical protein